MQMPSCRFGHRLVFTTIVAGGWPASTAHAQHESGSALACAKEVVLVEALTGQPPRGLEIGLFRRTGYARDEHRDTLALAVTDSLGRACFRSVAAGDHALSYRTTRGDVQTWKWAKSVTVPSTPSDTARPEVVTTEITELAERILREYAGVCDGSRDLTPPIQFTIFARARGNPEPWQPDLWNMRIAQPREPSPGGPFALCSETWSQRVGRYTNGMPADRRGADAVLIRLKDGREWRRTFSVEPPATIGVAELPAHSIMGQVLAWVRETMATPER
jgi:hypothetical protein